MNFDWTTRKNKAVVRQYLFERLATVRAGVPLTSYLCLPGFDRGEYVAGQCIQQGIASGCITPATRVSGYEWSAESAKGIRQFFSSRRPEYDISVTTGNLLDSEPRNVDYAFLDFTGNVGKREFRWMRDMFLPALIGSSFAITIPIGRNEGSFFHGVKAELDADPKFKFQFTREYYLWKKRSPEPLLAVWLFMLKCLMRDYHNRLFDILYYHDGQHVPMAVFLFEDVHARASDEARVYPELREEVCMATKKTKSELSAIAHRAVETRRTNAEKKRLSEIAFRAVATRRANAEKKRRSEIAHRAVATRRANAAA
jgi:hypothetical protein